MATPGRRDRTTASHAPRLYCNPVTPLCIFCKKKSDTFPSSLFRNHGCNSGGLKTVVVFYLHGLLLADQEGAIRARPLLLLLFGQAVQGTGCRGQRNREGKAKESVSYIFCFRAMVRGMRMLPRCGVVWCGVVCRGVVWCGVVKLLVQTRSLAQQRVRVKIGEAAVSDHYTLVRTKHAMCTRQIVKLLASTTWGTFPCGWS